MRWATGVRPRSLTTQGNGTVTLGNAATSLINGTAVNVANGTLNFNAAGALGTQANVTVSNGATVNLGANPTFGSLNGTSSTAGVALGTNTLTIGSSNNLSGSFAGAISGTGSVTIAGTGTATLAGANGYTGGTSVTAGTLLVTNSTGSGTGTGTVTVGSGATLGGSGSISGNVVVNSGGTLSPGTASTPEGTLTLSAGNLTLSSGASLSMNVGNANATSHDQVTVTNGTLSLGTSPTINVTINAGGNIALGNYTLIQASSVSGTATWNTTMTNAPAADTYRVAANGTSVLLNVAVPVATTLLFLQQPTTAPQNATISPAVAVEVLDQFGRLMAVDNNTVALAIGTNPLGNGTLSGNGTMAMVGGIATFSNLSINVIGNGYTLSATDSQDRLNVTSSTFNVTPVPGTFIWTGNAADGSWTNPQNWSVSGSPTPTDLYPGQYSGYVVDTVVFNKPGTVTLNGNQSVAGIQFNTGAAIIINPTSTTDTLTIGTGGISLAAGANTTDSINAAVALTGNETWTIYSGDSLTVSGNISGSGYSLTESGGGTLKLGGTNSYSGGTVLSSGILVVASSSGLGSGAGVALNGGTLDLATGTSINAYNVTVGGTATIASDLPSSGVGITYTLGTLSIGASTLTVAGGNNVTSSTAGLTFGAATLSGTATFNMVNPANGGTTVLTVGAVANGANTATFTGNGNFAQTGVWGSGAGGLILGAGYSGTATLSQANTYTGSTTINGGVLSISADTNLGTAPSSATPASLVINGSTLLDTGTFTLSANRGLAIGPTSRTGNGTMDVTGTNTLTYYGIIANNGSGAGQLVKIDTGTLALGGVNTYSGGTTVTGGVVEVLLSGTLSPGPVTENGGTIIYQQAPAYSGMLVFDAEFDDMTLGSQPPSSVWDNSGGTSPQIVNNAGSGNVTALAMTRVVNGAEPEIQTTVGGTVGDNLAYGRVEASIMIPGGPGSGNVWPAFWMLGTGGGWPGDGEIDIMENRGVNCPNEIQGTIHDNNDNEGNNTGVTTFYDLPNGEDFYTGYHIFAVDWTPT